MVTTQQITPAQFLEYYGQDLLYDFVNVKVGTEQRVYAKTTRGQAYNPDGHIIVYAVVT